MERQMTVPWPRWRIAGEYFENCNCKVVCPCLLSPNPPFTSRPTEGDCKGAFAFHVNSGSHGDVTLDGLNVAMIAHTPGPMGEGNWSVVYYFDERANDRQHQALAAIFTGTAGGPMGAWAPMISTVLGTKIVPIIFNVEGKRRSVEIPNIMHVAVQPLPSLDPDNEIWALNAHPFAPKVALAVGDQNISWTDYGMSWDNSGKHGYYAPINWSSA